MKFAAFIVLLVSLWAPLWAQTEPPSPTQIIGLSPDVVKAIQDAITAAAQNSAASPKPAVTVVAPVAPIPMLPMPLPIPVLTGLTPTNLPKFIITGGGGFASPSGKFAYVSASSLVLPQNTYATVAQEYTLLKGQVQSCTFAGVTKPIYQFSFITAGLTGLGGGCNSTNGDSAPAGSGQFFTHFRFGKFGFVLTFMKNTNSQYKITGGFSFNQ